MTTLIERNTTIPVKKTEVFSTAEDNQTAVDVHVLQGERPMAKDNMSLGRFRLEGIPPAPRGVPQIEVTFDIDANGIINVNAQDKATGKQQNVTITATTNLGENEIDNMVKEAREHEADDRRLRELIEARNTADSLIYQTEKTIMELGDKVPDGERQNIENKLDELRKAKESDDIDRLKQLSEEIQNAFHAISQQLYAQQQTSAPSAEGPTDGNGRGPSDGGSEDEGEVVEGEFREA
jgi:molecular chaperone DnaK